MIDPHRGEVWLVESAPKGAPPQAGRRKRLAAQTDQEPADVERPAVIVSVSGILTGIPTESVVVVPISEVHAPSALRPRTPGGATSGLAADSVAVVRAVRAVTRTRLAKRIGTVDPETMIHIDRALQLLLGLPLREAAK